MLVAEDEALVLTSTAAISSWSAAPKGRPRVPIRTRTILTDVSDIKIFIAIITVFTVLAISAFLRPSHPQATGIFPQVVSCVNENPDHRPSDPHWQPTLRVKVEPNRDPGRVREYRVLGCRLYYYHRYFR